MRRFIAAFCIILMAFSSGACSKKADDHSNQTLTGKVTSIDGTKITIQLGELNELEKPQEEMEQPDPPSGEESSGEESSGQPTEEALNGEEPPKQPTGEESSGEEPPEMPTGDGTSGNEPPKQPTGEESSGEELPEMPTGEGQPGGNMGMSQFTAGDETVTLDFKGAEINVEAGVETKEGTLDDVDVDLIVVVETGDNNAVMSVTVKFAGGMGQPDGNFEDSGQVVQGSAANTISSDDEVSECTYISSGDDENALRVDGAAVALSDVKIEKTAGASSNTEDGDFYGMNAAFLATNQATVTIKDSTITSSAQNGNGVFSYGSGTTVNVSDCKITTTADNSGGIQTTGGGTTKASNLTIETSGNSSAAIRSDRGGGIVQTDGGSYTTNGYNSPSVYSTADITVKNASLTANNSEALVIEGKNSIVLENCSVSGNMSDTKGTSSDENVHNVMIYQSMSGDADVGTSSFSMTGGTLLSNNGDMFYVTNTHCILKLSDVELIQKDKDGYLLNVTGNSASRGWGTAGKNGGQVEFMADGQKLEGDIVVDSISALDMTLSGESEFTGTVHIVDNAQGGTAEADNVSVKIEAGSTWTLTGDCTLTSLENEGEIDYNGYTITLADGTVLKQ